jgi:carbon-monoxide dehydrogenase medium subunit
MRVSAAEALLLGAKPSRELIMAASGEATKLADPSADLRGSVAFKKAMSGVLVGRALVSALEHLGVGGLR